MSAEFTEYWNTYTDAGFKAIKCRGYHTGIPCTSQDIRSNAKIPVTTGYSKAEFQGLGVEECLNWIADKGWIGFVLPKDYIALDVDKDIAHIKQIDSLIKSYNLNIPVHTTKNGKHFIFRTPSKLTANTSVLLKLGINVTYRIGGKSQLILAPVEKPHRFWDDIDYLQEPGLLPDLLQPLDLKNTMDVIEAINYQIKYYFQAGVLAGLDLDFSYAGFLVDELNCDLKLFKKLFKDLFGSEYDDIQTEKMFKGAKRDLKQSTGTLIQILQEKNLKHIIFLINSISRLTEVKELSPERVIQERNQVVQYFNKQHSVIDMGGKIVVMKSYYNPELETHSRIFYDFPNFKRKYQSMAPVFINKKPVAQTDIYLSSENRREYDRLDYIPGLDTEHMKIYNTWNGFAYTPKEGSCNKYLNHVKEIICSNNEDIYEYVLNWMADAVQNLRERPGVALILTGSQGTGKGIYVQNFGSLFGEHCLHLCRSNALTGNFNSELMSRSLVFADEAFWGGNKEISGVLKGLITEQALRIELKGKEPFYVKNYMRLICASNNNKVVPAEVGERRFFVLEVSNSRKADKDYFDSICEEMENGGRSALLKFLLERDISGVNLRNFPKTEALINQKMNNLESIDSFCYSFLETGNLETFIEYLCLSQVHSDFVNKNLEKKYSVEGISHSSWPSSISATLFFKIYRFWAKENDKKYALDSQQSFSIAIKKNIGVTCGRIKYNGKWGGGYTFKSLEDSRKHFEKYLGQPIFIDEEPSRRSECDDCDDLGLE